MSYIKSTKFRMPTNDGPTELLQAIRELVSGVEQEFTSIENSGPATVVTAPVSSGGGGGGSIVVGNLTVRASDGSVVVSPTTDLRFTVTDGFTVSNLGGGASLIGFAPSGVLLLNQTSPQTFTGGTVTGSGLLKVTAGLLGLDTNTYLTTVTAHNILSATHGDTLADSVVAGDIIIGNATPKWARLAKGTDGYILTLVSGLPSWQPGGVGSGITSLNGLTASIQTFAKTDDTNVTLSISSVTSTHTFIMGWSGQLSLSRGGTGGDFSAVTDGQILIGKTSDNSLNLATITGTTSRLSVINAGGSITLNVPDSSQLNIAKIVNLTTNGFVKTSSSDGSLSIDTNTYVVGSASNLSVGNSIQVIAGTGTGATLQAVTLDTIQDIRTTASPQFKQMSLVAGTIGPNNPILSISGTWNNSSANQGLLIDITPTLAGAPSYSFVTQNTGTNVFGIDRDGNISLGTWQGTAVGTQYGGTGIDTHSSTGLPWVSSGTWTVTTTQDVQVQSLGIGVAGFGLIMPFHVVQATQNATIANIAVLSGATLTNVPAHSENTDIAFSLNRTVTWATGSLTTQRAVLISAPTYEFNGASTLTNAATLAITGAPAAGSNATITNSYALWIQAGLSNLAGNLQTPKIGIGGAPDAGAVNILKVYGNSGSGNWGISLYDNGNAAEATHLITTTVGLTELYSDAAISLKAVTSFQVLVNTSTVGLNVDASGNITTGVWHGTAVSSTYGGTGIDSHASTGVPSVSSGTWSVSAQLGLTLGGTNANLTAANGGIVYSTASALAISSATATAGQALISGASTTPTWFAPTAGSVIYAGTSGVLSQDNASFYYDGSAHKLFIGDHTGNNFGLLNITSTTGNDCFLEIARHEYTHSALINFRLQGSSGSASDPSFSLGLLFNTHYFTVGSWDGTTSRSIWTIDTAWTTTINYSLVLGAATGGAKGVGTLNVAGDIYKNNTAYNNPDYVFESYYLRKKIEGYSMTPLDELNSVLLTSLHLPGISRETSGIFERADIVLEKLEQAYLYIVELNNKIKQLKGETQ